jgi:surface protein
MNIIKPILRKVVQPLVVPVTGLPISGEDSEESWSTYWLTQTPSTLALTNMGYPEGIKLDWLNTGTDYDGTSIERSADGVTYAEIGTVASGILTYTDATAVFQTLYYYRVRAYKGTNYSPYSNIESLEVTSDRFMITVDTTKAGSAADTFVLPTDGSGTYDYYLDWGDGSAEEHVTVNTSQTHVYAASGTYQIKIRGTFPRIYFNNAGDCAKLIYIDNWGNIAWSSMYCAFYGCSNMNSTTIDTANTSLVTSFVFAFYDCSSLTTLDVSGWDTREVMSFAYAFRDCSSLTTLDTSGWNTAKVTTFNAAFRSCSLLTTLDTSGWNTA